MLERACLFANVVCLGAWLILSGIAACASSTLFRDDGSLILSDGDRAPVRFAPTFLVLHTTADPQPELRRSSERVYYDVATWRVGADTVAEPSREANRSQQLEVGEGHVGVSSGQRAGEARTSDYLKSAERTIVRANAWKRTGDRVTWEFPDQDAFTLRATVEAGSGASPPTLRFEFRAKRAGWYSIGYTGAEPHPLSDVEEVFQPLVWQEKRFPSQSYLTLAFRAPVPATFVSRGGLTYGVSAAAEEFPFEPLPGFDNSRFGVMVRNGVGKARPALFAPVLGGRESWMEPGQRYAFAMHPVLYPGGCSDAFERVSRDLFGVRD